VLLTFPENRRDATKCIMKHFKVAERYYLGMYTARN
jgi:hypothetical protein